MGVAQYKLGRDHALRGYRSMTHRSKKYDSESAQRSYNQGFSDGLKLRFPNQYQKGAVCPPQQIPLPLAST